MSAARYASILADVVATLDTTVGPGHALQALGLGHPMAPTGVTEFDSRVRLSAYAESARGVSEQHARDLAVRAADAGLRFLEQLRRERLRQAATSFNAALSLLSVGTLIVLAGAVLLFMQRTTAGALTAAAGAVANISSALVFRFNRNANDRLDRLAKGLGKLEGTQRALQLLSAGEEGRLGG